MESGSMMEKLTSNQLAVYRLVERFVERQKIVFDAMIELHPILMFRAGVIPESQLSPITRARGKPSIIFVGDWGGAKEWNYFLHGAGCRLIHKITNEPIDWDAPDTQRFDRHWFFVWVKWLLGQADNAELAAIFTSVNLIDITLEKFLFDMLDQLQNLGRLVQVNPPYFNKYHFIAFPESQGG
jgi:hypothetical protein